MWKLGSIGHLRGWHFGQAHEMVHEMHRFNDDRDDENSRDNPIARFIEGFAERIGEKAADAVTPETT